MLSKILELIRLDRYSNCDDVKTWDVSQKYEMKAAIDFMEGNNGYKALFDLDKCIHTNKLSKINSRSYMNEFFCDNENKLKDYIEYTTNKNCLEIGPSVSPLISSFWWSKCNYIIEPLLDNIVQYQQSKMGCSIFDHTTNYSVGAEQLIPGLVGMIDGSVVCRNCLDHTPEWPFILSNIASYMSIGSYLLLWSDLFHLQPPDIGHYNITKDVAVFARFLLNLGFCVEYEFDIRDRETINFGCIARKI